MLHRPSQRNSVWSLLFILSTTLSLHACGDTNNVSGPAGPAAPGPLTILTSSPLPAGTTGVSYDITLAQSGGTPPYTWNMAPGSPALPNGLVLTPSTGRISGTPTTTGTTNTEFTLQDSNGQSVKKVLSMTFNIAPTSLAILTTSLTPGTINRDYAFALSGTGGITPYIWDLKAGTPPLPSGLILSSNGVISGTPTIPSNATHTFILTDATSLPVEKALQLSIRAIPLSITTTSLPAGTVNGTYNQTVLATGGAGALGWSVTSGALPPGLSLHASSGNISGEPTQTGSFNFTLRVTDQTSQFDEQNLRIAITSPSPPEITGPSSLRAGTVNQPYPDTQLTATGGVQPYSWSVNPALPNGLTFNPSSGVITGTPLSGSNGNSSHEFTVTDSTLPLNQQDKKTLSLTIRANVTPLTIPTRSLPDGRRNSPYTGTLEASGGVTPYTWSVTPALPDGLTLAPATGEISGTPTTASNERHEFTVRDSTNQTSTRELRLRVRNSSNDDDD
jgi:hypothetical protein